jgi:outer membrane protein TolC
MKRRVHTIWAILTALMTALSGCRPQQPYYLGGDGDLSHLLNVATEIEYPDVQSTTLAEVEEALPPLTLSNLDFASYWDLSLEEAIKNSLANSKVMKSLGGRYVSSAFNNRAQTGDAPDALTTGPDVARTVYDPAIIETTPFSGVEYALSAFDAQWANSLSYNKNDHPQNVLPQFPITNFFRPVFEEDTSTFNSQLTKITAQGGQFTVSNNIVYDVNNNPTRQLPLDWNVNYQVSFNQPLLAGAGAQFNRIAGPQNPFNNNIVPGGAQQTPAFDGVLLARINVDIGMADFEAGIRNLVSDTENAYWELAFAWRNLETSNTALNSARQTWKRIHELYVVGTKGGEASQEAQAREQFYQFKSQTQTLLNELFRAENRLRYVMGLAPTDGRLIRPTEKPTVAKVTFDWQEVTQEALARSLDLRRQKWRIKQQELQVIAAKNLIMPRLDLNGTYRWLGDGGQLFGNGVYNVGSLNSNSPQTGLLAGTSSLATLASGQFQEWQLGVQSTMTLGFRKELATVRYYQLSLARERAKLQDEELEVSHQLADAVRQMELNYELTETNFNRTLAADRQVEAVQAAYEAETITLDQVLEAQRRRADAQTSYFRTLLDYQRAIIMVHYRKGTILDYNNVYLQEGPWPAKAKFDAHRLARQRDASLYLNYGYTRPDVMSQGAVRQNPSREGAIPGGMEMLPTGGIPHEATTPEGVPRPDAEITVPLDGGAPTDDSFSNASPKAIRASGLSASQRGFEWGPLGLKSNDNQAENPTADKPTP